MKIGAILFVRCVIFFPLILELFNYGILNVKITITKMTVL